MLFWPLFINKNAEMAFSILFYKNMLFQPLFINKNAKMAFFFHFFINKCNIFLLKLLKNIANKGPGQTGPK
jgi:hypothetical protein